MNVLRSASGGAIAAAPRYLAGLSMAPRLGVSFPWGTFFVNVTGSFLIGIVLVLVETGTLSAEARLFLAVGILGGYTTFSRDRKSTRLNSSHANISYAVFCLKKKKHKYLLIRHL